MGDLQVQQPFNTPKYIPIDKLISLSEQGLSGPQIAKQVGCDPSNVYQRFQSVGYTHNRLKDISSTKTIMLSLLQSKFIQSIDDEEIKKAPVQTKIWSIGVLQDKIDNLERKSQGLQVEDAGMDGLSAQLAQIAARSPVVINNILQVVGSLPGDVRDRISNLIPASLPSGPIIDADASG